MNFLAFAHFLLAFLSFFPLVYKYELKREHEKNYWFSSCSSCPIRN